MLSLLLVALLKNPRKPAITRWGIFLYNPQPIVHRRPTMVPNRQKVWLYNYNPVFTVGHAILSYTHPCVRCDDVGYRRPNTSLELLILGGDASDTMPANRRRHRKGTDCSCNYSKKCRSVTTKRAAKIRRPYASQEIRQAFNFFTLICSRYSLVSLITNPESPSTAIKLGIAIRPFNVSAMFQTRDSSMVAPMMMNTMNRI